MRVGQFSKRCLWRWALFAPLFASGCGATAAQTAGHPWYEIKSARFQLFTDSDPKRGRDLVADLERFHQVALLTTKAVEREGASPLRVFLAKDRAAFASLTAAGAGVAGLFAATSRGNYAVVEDQDSSNALDMSARHILFHEYTHYISAMAGSRIPSWYNEGLAEYLATTQFDDTGAYTVGCPAAFRTAAVSRKLVQWLPITKLFTSENVATLMSSGSGGARTRRLGTESYAQSWYAFHYFSGDGERQAKLVEYLRLWTLGTPLEAAVQQAFGTSSAKLDLLLRDYAAQSSIECLKIKPKAPLREAVITVRALDAQEAHLQIADLALTMFGPTEAALAVLDAVDRSGDETHFLLTKARAQSLLAQRHPKAGAELDRAEWYVKRAQDRAPNNPEALTLHGDILRQRAEHLREQNPEGAKRAVAQARKAYRKAVYHDPNLAEAYYGLGLTYVLTDNGAKEALDTLETAAYLLPLDTGIRWALAQIHAGRGDQLQALAQLDYILRFSKNEELRAKAHALRDQLRARAAPATSAAARPVRTLIA